MRESGFSIKSLIRTIPDFPKPGILFRDITTLFKHRDGFRLTIDQLAAAFADTPIDKVAAIEARGFIIGGALADRLTAGFVPIRKRGKLPFEFFGHDYDLEYGADRLEIHRDAISPGEKVLLIDDLIATGGTAEAALALIAKAGGAITGCGFVIDLPDLGGHRRLEGLGHRVITLCEFEGH